MPESLGGLPLHPLIVHGAVVLLPLAAIGLVLSVLSARIRRRYGGLVIAFLVAGAGAALVAKVTGEALADRVGRPPTHARWGERLAWASIALLVLGAAWSVLARRADAHATPAADPPSGGLLDRYAVRVLAALTLVAALACLGLVVRTGHTGAQTVWIGVGT